MRTKSIQLFISFLKGPYRRETIVIYRFALTREIIVEPRNSSESTGPIDFHGWPDSGETLMKYDLRSAL